GPFKIEPDRGNLSLEEESLGVFADELPVLPLLLIQNSINGVPNLVGHSLFQTEPFQGSKGGEVLGERLEEGAVRPLDGCELFVIEPKGVLEEGAHQLTEDRGVEERCRREHPRPGTDPEKLPFESC